nr:integrase, catalytic region, zinc finger, CCHC-type, peptidase aspartic, catalytic [Tanacetum cinerariifolium]
KTASTPIETQKPLLKDEDGEKVDCKKQTLVANSTTEAKYVAASSCYGQFWTTAKSKIVNEEVQIHTLVDGMKVIITESSVRRDLQLADEDGIDCLLNTTIFENLALMGYEKPLLSAICLPLRRRFGMAAVWYGGGLVSGLQVDNGLIITNMIVAVCLNGNLPTQRSDTRPPMLDRTDYESWQQRIRLYCLGKDNGENIMKSIVEGPYQMGKKTVTLAGGVEGALQLGPEQDRVFLDLTQEEKDRYKADICATNILVQRLPKYIYALINYYTDAKDIWDNVKMLLEVSELTKDDRESQLYDDFEHFRQNKGENIHSYYVRFTKLINDMRNIKMTMPKMRLNSKFVNSMLFEWSRFITEVKLNRGLRESNFDQLYAYLKQHEVHATKNKIMLERFTQTTNDPLALVSNASVQQMFVVDIMRTIKEDSFRGTIQEDLLELGMLEDSDYFKDKMLLMQAQENEQDLALNVDHVFEADQCDAFDSDVDEAPTAQTMFMVNLSLEDPIYDEVGPSYDSNIPFEVQDHDKCSDSVYEHHDVIEMQNNVQYYVADSDADYTSDSNIILYDQYKELVGVYEKQAKFELTDREQKIDQQMRIIISDQNRKETSLNIELHSIKMQLRSTIGHNKSMKEEVTTLKKDFKQKEDKFLEEFIDIKALKEKVEDRLFKQDQSVQTAHMLCKPKPFYDEKKKVAIGYKKPLCLTHVKQVQPALYNGNEIVKTNHAPAVLHDSEDTLEIAEITRIRMSLKAQLKGKTKCVTIDPVKPKVHAPGVSSFTEASGSKPRSNIKKNRILPAKSETKKKVEDHHMTNKYRWIKVNRVDSSISSKHVVVQVIRWYLDLGCSKHMTGNLSKLKNFISKFIGTVRFGNDHCGAIMGYGDYVNDDSVISRVYYVEGLGHNLFSKWKFCDLDLEVAFRKHSCFVCDTEGVDLLKVMTEFYERIGIFHQKSVPRTPQQNGVVERQNRTLVEAARTMQIFSKAPIFLWAEAVATACYT